MFSPTSLLIRALWGFAMFVLLGLWSPNHVAANLGSPAAPLISATFEKSAADGGIPVDSCREINAPGWYELVADLKPRWSCLKIASDNVTLDCNSKTIKGLNFNGAAIIIERYGPPPGRQPTNIEIRNCKISNHQYGILVEDARDVRILRNDLSKNADDTRGSYFGPWMGAMDGGGLRMNRVQGGLVEENISNYGSNGIDLRDSERIIVRNNITNLNSGFGILLWNTSHSQVLGNTANDNSRWCYITEGQWKGWIVQGCDTAAILLQDGSSDNIIANNSLWGQNGDGIFIRAHGGMRCGDRITIANNVINGAIWNSIEAGFCNDIKITGNQIERSKIGIWLSFMDNVQILNNTFTNVDTYGVALKDSHHALVNGNVFRDSPEGIYLFWDPSNALFLRKPLESYASYGNTVVGNSFQNIHIAAIHLKDSTRNRFERNNFENVPVPYLHEGDTKNNVFAR